jgi:hypothetical protein
VGTAVDGTTALPGQRFGGDERDPKQKCAAEKKALRMLLPVRVEKTTISVLEKV